jgi:uncharacterized membrane protein
MQNLSISCALVCLIILGSSALVGVFGVLKHQISAVLVTGVMYLLAGQSAGHTLVCAVKPQRVGGNLTISEERNYLLKFRYFIYLAKRVKMFTNEIYLYAQTNVCRVWKRN